MEFTIDEGTLNAKDAKFLGKFISSGDDIRFEIVNENGKKRIRIFAKDSDEVLDDMIDYTQRA